MIIQHKCVSEYFIYSMDSNVKFWFKKIVLFQIELMTIVFIPNIIDNWSINDMYILQPYVGQISQCSTLFLSCPRIMWVDKCLEFVNGLCLYIIISICKVISKYGVNTISATKSSCLTTVTTTATTTAPTTIVTLILGLTTLVDLSLSNQLTIGLINLIERKDPKYVNEIIPSRF